MKVFIVGILCFCINVLSASSTFAQNRMSKAVVTKDHLYVEDGQGNLALVELKGNSPAKFYGLSSRTVANVPRCWDVADANLIVTDAAKGLAGQVGIAVLRVPLKEVFASAQELGHSGQMTTKPAVQPDLTQVSVRGGPLASATVVSGFVNPPSAIVADIFVDEKNVLLMAAQTRDQLLQEVMHDKTREQTNSSVKSGLDVPFVILPAGVEPKRNEEMILVDIGGKTYQSKDGRLALRPSKEQNNVAKDIGVNAQRIILVVDKRQDVPRCFRFGTDGKTTNLLDIPVDDIGNTTKDETSQVSQALNRALSGLK